MNRKKICVITCSRADYNYLKLIIEKIDKSKILELSLIVTGMHLLEEHDKTVELIKKDKIPISRTISMYEENDFSSVGLGKAVGNSIVKFAEAFDELKPKLILLLGDRFEHLVPVIAATTLNIPIAHIHGGDISGTVDETIRHAITKLAHIHFPATLKSAERIKLMGEEDWRINMVGSTSVDIVMNEPLLTKEEICRKLELNPDEKIILCLQHPNVFEAEYAGEQMKITLQVLKDFNLQTIIIYPNNDLGSNLIIKEIKNNESNPKFKIFKNLERNLYLSLLKNINLLIGNSSSGLIESPIFKLPVINIGSRNKDRETAENVISVDQFNFNDIKNAVFKAFSKEFIEKCQKVKNPYGDGTTSDKIIEIIEGLEINEALLIKKLTYKV